jgi:hypothetical protein
MVNIQKVFSSLSDLDGVPADIGAEDLANKGVANGYAALDSSGNIAVGQMQFSVDLWDSSL